MTDKIIIKGARANNLKNIDLELPRDKLIVMTRLSARKVLLAFDTIYADGQRRYVEPFLYARMFLGQMEKPDVDSIESLLPYLSTRKRSRILVPLLVRHRDIRLPSSLYARIGVPHCPVCGREISQQSIDQMVDAIMELPEGTRLQLLAPIVRGRKGQYVKELESARKSVFVRVRIDGIMYELSEDIKLDKNKKHNIEIVVDRIIVKEGIQSRITDSLETVFSLTEGLALVNVIDGEDMLFSQNYACPEHNISIGELEPVMFSFNNPIGACPKCTGLGVFRHIDPELVVPNKELSIMEGAINAPGWNSLDETSVSVMYYKAIAEKYGVDINVPVKKLKSLSLTSSSTVPALNRWSSDVMNPLAESTYTTPFEGVINNLERRHRETSASGQRPR